MSKFQVHVFLIPVLLQLLPLTTNAQAQPNELYQNVYKFWQGYRDPRNGLYCDNQDFKSTTVCGPKNNFYSSAAVGMGMVAETVFAEIGLQNFTTSQSKIEETLNSFVNLWPQENNFGYFQHFCDDKFQVLAEYSTIDSAILVAGASFAGNYFGGNVKSLADNLLKQVDWSAAIPYEDDSQIYMVADDNANPPCLKSPTRVFNEYYLVAYLAKITDPNNQKIQNFFQTYFGTTAKPVGGSDGRPFTVTYEEYEALSDGKSYWISSFIPQFLRFLSRGFNQNPYYKQEMLVNWLKADQSFWRDSVQNLITPFEVWGDNVENKIFGCGAGDSPNSGYSVQKILNVGPDYTFSTQIMAGFLGVDSDANQEILDNLNWLFDNGICRYTKNYDDGSFANVLWRCSVSDSEWRANRPTSIDFSSMVLGYATVYLDEYFFETFAI